MSRERRDPETARLTRYGKQQLEELVADLATTKPVLEVNEWDLVGGLIVAARRSPIEAVRAVVATYRDTELVDVPRAYEAVVGFLRAHAQ